jgi:putative phage-type endonuclease
MSADLTREEWLALRRQSLGASEAAAACGEDPTVSPLELVLRKRGQMPEPDLDGNEAVAWGLLLEPAIVRESARRANLHVLGRATIETLFADDAHTELVGFVEGTHPFLRSRARPWQTATPDAIACSRELGNGTGDHIVAIEAKNAGQYTADSWSMEEGRAPEKHQLQVVHQLAVAPRFASGILAGLVGGNSLRSVRLERVRIVQVIEALVVIEERVWGCVKSGEMPELSGPPASVARALKALHPEDNGESVVLDGLTAQLAWDLERAKAERKRVDGLVEELSNRIRAALGPATFGVMPDGTGVYSLKTQERAEHSVSASKCRVLRFAKTKAKKASKDDQ